MVDAWYYAHDANRIGPFSARQLKNLADLGTVVPSDTIWKEGVEKGVLAGRIKNLFSLPAAIVEVAPDSSPPPLVGVPPLVPTVPDEILVNATAAPEKPVSKPPPKPAKKGRAVAIKGADIVSQDGTHAKYRKKCTVCGHQDSSCQSVAITNMTTTTGYYCPKCKKKRDVTIQCFGG